LLMMNQKSLLLTSTQDIEDGIQMAK
jgi:hypothetical protein